MSKLKAFWALLAVAGLVFAPMPVLAQGLPVIVKSITLAADYDLDGLASSATAIHSADAITDGASFTIDAQPDTPRPLAATLTDGDSSISACTYTVVGTQADGTIITATTALTGGSGVKTLSPSYNWATVTSASVGTCTGEGGGDTVSLGTTSTVPTQYFTAYGSSRLNSEGVNVRNPWAWGDPAKIKPVKSGATSVDVTAVTASSAPFTGVAVGDILLFNVGGDILERVVVTVTDTDNIVVEKGLVIPSTGVNFKQKKIFRGPDSEDGWFNVGKFSQLWIYFNVTQMGTNNMHTFVQCEVVGAGGGPVTVDTDAVTTAGVVLTTIDPNIYDRCRAGMDFDTNDDAVDGTTEKITITVSGVGVQ